MKAPGTAGAPTFTPRARALALSVLESSARRHGVTVAAARSSRVGAAVAARAEWFRVVRDSWALSISDTARICGADRTTVIHALRRLDP